MCPEPVLAINVRLFTYIYLKRRGKDEGGHVAAHLDVQPVDPRGAAVDVDRACRINERNAIDLIPGTFRVMHHMCPEPVLVKIRMALSPNRLSLFFVVPAPRSVARLGQMIGAALFFLI